MAWPAESEELKGSEGYGGGEHALILGGGHRGRLVPLCQLSAAGEGEPCWAAEADGTGLGAPTKCLSQVPLIKTLQGHRRPQSLNDRYRVDSLQTAVGGG